MVGQGVGSNADETIDDLCGLTHPEDRIERKLDNYPLLRACLEDHALVLQLRDGRIGTARHGVVLMHDALEFLLYEILVLADEDIYADGQHTIGLNTALSRCLKIGVDLPLMGTIRSIQKHRGDAKHHAQVPHDKAYRKMVDEFEVVITRLVYEHFGAALDDHVTKLNLMPYQTALYDSYRKYRNHNWSLALRFILGALLHKYRRLLSTKDIYSGIPNEPAKQTIQRLAEEFRAVDKRKAKELVAFVQSLPDELIALADANDNRSCAEAAAKAFSRMDELIPSFFRSDDAVFLTPRLVKAQHMRIGGRVMGWAAATVGDTKRKESYLNAVAELLRKNKELVNDLGAPEREDEDDRYWELWNMAVFDGMRWHTFELHRNYRILLESMSNNGEEAEQRERVARLVLEEFTEAVERKRA